jgi:hypothetical protein
MVWAPPPSGKRGRQQQFSDAAIQTCLTLKVLFGMPLRQTTGFVQSLLRLVGLDWVAPDFSTLCRRQKTLNVGLPYRGSRGPLHLLIDSTGIKAEGVQSKTKKPVRFEISVGTRASVAKWMEDPIMVGSEYLWPGRFHERVHISTRRYARIVRDWVTSIGLEATAYGTHSMRRTKVTQIYKKTGNLRAVQLLLGHTKMDSTVRYLGVELEDALAISEAIEI